MEKWILVDDELPPNCGEVLTIFKGWDDMVFQRVLEYDKYSESWSDWNGDDFYKVLAWQSLPDISMFKV